ncbi:2942_t:CDS:1, partial [Funneliformis geosporum]
GGQKFLKNLCKRELTIAMSYDRSSVLWLYDAVTVKNSTYRIFKNFY